MRVLAAWDEGWRRALRAPWLIAGTWLTTLLVALPAVLTLRRMLATHLGASLAAETAVSAVNFDWWNEFLAQASGLGQTFVPAILGFAAVLQNVSALADGQPIARAVQSIVALHLAVSLFLMGGVLDRLARDRAIGAAAFFSACGVYFFRFLRLGVIAGVLYWTLFVWVHPLLFDQAYRAVTRDLTVERTAFMVRVAWYLLFGALIVGVNVVFDYAKVRMVVEDRMSAIGALASSLRFIARHPGAVLGLYAWNAAVFAIVVALYAAAAPGATSGDNAWIALLIGQLYIVLRITVRLTFSASQIALFQSRLAHAGYTARPVPAWPDSPAVEALRPE